MNASEEFPSFDVLLPDLNKSILELIKDYRAGKINSWEELEERVNAFFTPERMAEVESIVPGWRKMASSSNGVTLVHVMCVFLGLVMLPEFQNLSPEQQQLAKWIVLFHDVEKAHVRGKKDLTHAFRSAVLTAGRLKTLGFITTEEHESLLDSWSELTASAVTKLDESSDYIQDNQKLPGIVEGIGRMFGENTPATLITEGVLLHMSIDVVEDYLQAAPLTDEEINRYVNTDLVPLLKVMMLADNEGWVMFYPEDRLKQRNQTLKVFENVERRISI
jgi:hypothetical protein